MQANALPFNFKGEIEVFKNGNKIEEYTNKIMRQHIPAVIGALARKDSVDTMGAGNDDTAQSTDLTEMTSVTDDTKDAIFTEISDTVLEYPLTTIDQSTDQEVEHDDTGVATFVSNFSNKQTKLDGSNGPITELALITEKDRLFSRTILDPGVPKPDNTTVTFKWSIFYGIN